MQIPSPREHSCREQQTSTEEPRPKIDIQLSIAHVRPFRFQDSSLYAPARRSPYLPQVEQPKQKGNITLKNAHVTLPTTIPSSSHQHSGSRKFFVGGNEATHIVGDHAVTRVHVLPRVQLLFAHLRAVPTRDNHTKQAMPPRGGEGSGKTLRTRLNTIHE